MRPKKEVMDQTSSEINCRDSQESSLSSTHYNYCEKPIDLASVVNAAYSSSEKNQVGWSIYCGGTTKPYHYCMEMETTRIGTDQISPSSSPGQRNGTSALDYRLKVHPPLCVENLLAESAIIKLYDANNAINGEELWEGAIDAGKSKHIYFVGSETKLKLYVELKEHNCLSTNKLEIRGGKSARRGNPAPGRRPARPCHRL